jgi:hypothetical protein
MTFALVDSLVWVQWVSWSVGVGAQAKSDSYTWQPAANSGPSTLCFNLADVSLPDSTTSAVSERCELNLHSVPY